MGKRESESVGHIQSAYCEGQKEVVTAAHNRCNRFLQREVQVSKVVVREGAGGALEIRRGDMTKPTVALDGILLLSLRRRLPSSSTSTRLHLRVVCAMVKLPSLAYPSGGMLHLCIRS